MKRPAASKRRRRGMRGIVRPLSRMIGICYLSILIGKKGKEDSQYFCPLVATSKSSTMIQNPTGGTMSSSEVDYESVSLF